MIERDRRDFNQRFTPAKYEQLLRTLNERTRTEIGFRVAETPCFFEASLLESMATIGIELTEQLLSSQQYRQDAAAATPEAWRVPHPDSHPHFMTVDFGLVRSADGTLAPKLVEMQAFPSLYGYQPVLAKAYMDVYGLDPELKPMLGGRSEDSYWQLLREVIVGKHEAENVVLLELDPFAQKTLVDFRVHAERLGIEIVDVRAVKREGNKLFYRETKRGRLVPVERIYNRVIVDELERRQIRLPFDYRDDLQVEWAGHPNWYFEISKFSLPYLRHEAVPPAVFLDEWRAGLGHDRLPLDRDRWILKPLYSFAGQGIQFAPSDVTLASIPADQGHRFLLQERVDFVAPIDTPEEPTQAEVRILYVWPDTGQMMPIMSLVRMGRGQMMGVDHNRNRSWVGSSAALCRKGSSSAKKTETKVICQ
jgi:hypothetical protein